MALTFYEDDNRAYEIGDTISQFSGKFDCDATYATGGYALPNNMKIKQQFNILKGVYFENKGGYTFEYNRSTEKIMVYVSGGTQVSNGVNLSALTSVHMRAEGWS